MNVHDCPEPQLGRAIPYGIYDVGHNKGWVSVGQDHDTASFAVASLRRWWQVVGYPSYPQARQLLTSVELYNFTTKEVVKLIPLQTLSNSSKPP